MSRPNGPAVPPNGVSTRPARQLNQPLPPGQNVPLTDQLAQHGYQQVPPTQPRAAGYAPQFDPYQQQPAAYAPQPHLQSAPQAQPAYDPSAHAAAYHHQPMPYAQPAASQPAAPPPQQRVSGPAYDQWTAAAASQDPRGYDMGGYSPQPQHREPAPYQQPAYQAQAPMAQPSHADWGQHQGYGQPAAEPSLDPSAYAADHAQSYGSDQQMGAADPNQEYAEDEEYEYDEAPRGKWMKIAAALVGAIVVGGGLAYAYTSLVAGGSGQPPVIKSASGPSKIKPADPGGKKFANAESKLMGRLNEGSGAAADASGVKKVSTVPVAADGSLVPPPEAPAQAPAAPAADDAFPGSGATLAGTLSPGSPAAPPAAVAAAADQPVTVTPPKALEKPIEMAAAAADQAKPSVSPTVTNSISAAAAATQPAAAPATPPAVKKVATAATAAPAAAVTAPAAAPAVKKAVATPAAVAPTSTGNGYVAVLASVPVSNSSRINALKQFADMQQKYGAVLQNKMPDVREANLGEKGTYHRLLVGPPGSREGAQALCGSLKAAGYPDSCWVTAY